MGAWDSCQTQPGDNCSVLYLLVSSFCRECCSRNWNRARRCCTSTATTRVSQKGLEEWDGHQECPKILGMSQNIGNVPRQCPRQGLPAMLEKPQMEHPRPIQDHPLGFPALPEGILFQMIPKSGMDTRKVPKKQECPKTLPQAGNSSSVGKILNRASQTYARPFQPFPAHHMFQIMPKSRMDPKERQCPKI